MTSVFKSVAAFCDSSIGKKLIVAVTGLVLLLFLAGHLAGNLLIFKGPDDINEYAEFLKTALHGSLIWIARIVLLTCFVLHIVYTVLLTKQNRAARTERYEHEKTIQASSASRTMIISGLIILAFVVFHLLHYTAQVTHPEFQTLKDAEGRHDVYSMVVMGFQSFPVSLFYIIAVGLLCFHLSHGFASVFQTLGIRSKRTGELLKCLGIGYAALIFLGNFLIVVSILFGWVGLPETETAMNILPTSHL